MQVKMTRTTVELTEQPRPGEEKGDQIKSPLIGALYAVHFTPNELRFLAGFLDWLLENKLVEWTPKAATFFDSSEVEAFIRKYLS